MIGKYCIIICTLWTQVAVLSVATKEECHQGVAHGLNHLPKDETVSICSDQKTESERVILTGQIKDKNCNVVSSAIVYLAQFNSEDFQQHVCRKVTYSDENGLFQVEVSAKQMPLHVEIVAVKELTSSRETICLPGESDNKICKSEEKPENVMILEKNDRNIQFVLKLKDEQKKPRQKRDLYYTDTDSDGYLKKKWNDDINWLRKRSFAEESESDYPIVHFHKRTPSWEAAGAKWLKRAWDDADLHWLKKRDLPHNSNWPKRVWNSAGMNWIKRNGAGTNRDWYKRTWGNDMSWLKKRGWQSDDSIMDWMKRDTDSLRDLEFGVPEQDARKRLWDDAGINWIKRDTSGSYIHHVNKRSTPPEKKLSTSPNLVSKQKSLPNVSNIKEINKVVKTGKDKKAWNNAGMTWIKRDGDKKAWDNPGMSWIKRDGDKRAWENAGISWIKKKKVPTATLR